MNPFIGRGRYLAGESGFGDAERETKAPTFSRERMSWAMRRMERGMK